MDSIEIQNPTPDKTEQFVQSLTENQNRIFAYVYSLLGDHARTSDVVQETNLTLWRKIGDYDPGKPFLPWAFAFARNQVLANIRNQQRDRIVLDETVVELVSEEVQQQAGQLESIQQALKLCLERLSKSSRQLIQHRYFHSKSISEVAETMGKSAGSMKVALLRARNQLGQCIQRKIAKEA